MRIAVLVCLWKAAKAERQKGCKRDEGSPGREELRGVGYEREKGNGGRSVKVQHQAGVLTSFWGEAASALREATRQPIRDERPHKSPCPIGPIRVSPCGNSLLDLPKKLRASEGLLLPRGRDCELHLLRFGVFCETSTGLRKLLSATCPSLEASQPELEEMEHAQSSMEAEVWNPQTRSRGSWGWIPLAPTSRPCAALPQPAPEGRG
ncbi:hypothetical protein VTJ49DRAFT_4069 [Mycothermus thermophilus]|uniref:Uncharacterized protein n=1 Tax=Humicola insolens TaxID=85995 RepID=A0ABR3V669_HUMIN